MIIKCKYNTGEVLLPYERKPLGTSAQTQYGELDIDREYIVMGMIMKSGYLTYCNYSGTSIKWKKCLKRKKYLFLRRGRNATYTTFGL
jgi:hypothetical protein